MIKDADIAKIIYYYIIYKPYMSDIKRRIQIFCYFYNDCLK